MERGDHGGLRSGAGGLAGHMRRAGAGQRSTSAAKRVCPPHHHAAPTYDPAANPAEQLGNGRNLISAPGVAPGASVWVFAASMGPLGVGAAKQEVGHLADEAAIRGAGDASVRARSEKHRPGWVGPAPPGTGDGAADAALDLPGILSVDRSHRHVQLLRDGLLRVGGKQRDGGQEVGEAVQVGVQAQAQQRVGDGGAVDGGRRPQLRRQVRQTARHRLDTGAAHGVVHLQAHQGRKGIGTEIGGDHQGFGPDAGLDGKLQQGQAVDFRQHQVYHQQIGPEVAQQRQRLSAVAAGPDLIVPLHGLPQGLTEFVALHGDQQLGKIHRSHLLVFVLR